MSVTEMQKLSELLKSVHDLTGMKVAVYNLAQEELIAYPDQASDICRSVCRRETTLQACKKSMDACYEACRQQQAAQTIQCPGGLMQIIVPVIGGSSVIGYILLGQFVREQDRSFFVQQLTRLCQNHGLTEKQGLELASHVPYCNDVQIRSASRIMDMTASYLVYTGLLYPGQTPLRQTILEYIGKNLSADLSVQALCQRFSVSKSELYRLTRQQASSGIAAYVRQKRFAKACELLHHTRKPIWQIAEEVGYDNPDYFLRAFKRELGVSAGKYRKSTG